MARIGATYYPKTYEIRDIVKENVKKVNVDDAIKLDYDSDPYQLFQNYKTSILGIRNFVVSGTLEIRLNDRLQQIYAGKLDREKLYFNPVEAYKLINEVNYVLNVVEDPYKRAMAYKALGGEVETLVKNGLNLEEIKMDLLFDNFIAFNEIDKSEINTDFNEALLENALSTYNTICKFDKLSPYNKILNMYSDLVNEKDENLARIKEQKFEYEVSNCDLNMLRMFTYNKAIADILKCVLRLHFSVKENPSLDAISRVVYVKPFEYGISKEPIVRREFNEDVAKDLYELATLQKEVKLGDLLDRYKAFVRELKREMRDLDAKRMIDDYALNLSLYSKLAGIQNRQSHDTDRDRYDL